MSAAIVAVALLVAGGFLVETWHSARGLRDLAPPGARVELGGRALHVWCEGDGRPVVVLEASGPGIALHWAEVMKGLRSQTQVCAIDRAGMGWSDAGPLPRTTARITEDARQALANLGVPAPYILAGASFGGLTMRHWALAHPEEIAGLVMVDAFHEDVASAAPEALAGLERLLLATRVAARIGLLRLLDPFHLDTGPEARRGLEAVAYRSSAWEAVHSMVAARGQSIAELPSPRRYRQGLPLVVLVHGRAGDLIGPGFETEARRFEPAWQRLQAEIARADDGELRVIVDSGHLIHIERPETVSAALYAVLERAKALEAATGPR